MRALEEEGVFVVLGEGEGAKLGIPRGQEFVVGVGDGFGLHLLFEARDGAVRCEFQETAFGVRRRDTGDLGGQAPADTAGNERVAQQRQ